VDGRERKRSDGDGEGDQEERGFGAGAVAAERQLAGGESEGWPRSRAAGAREAACGGAEAGGSRRGSGFEAAQEFARLRRLARRCPGAGGRAKRRRRAGTWTVGAECYGELGGRRLPAGNDAAQADVRKAPARAGRGNSPEARARAAKAGRDGGGDHPQTGTLVVSRTVR